MPQIRTVRTALLPFTAVTDYVLVVLQPNLI
jgi:hypothetical protein